MSEVVQRSSEVSGGSSRSSAIATALDRLIRAPALRGRADRRVLPAGTLELVGRADLDGCEAWARAFAGCRKDHRYYELVQDTIEPRFEHLYLLIRDERGTTCAVQPAFIVDQDLLAGTGRHVAHIAARVRNLWPRFMRLRTLMLGCAAGEGHLPGTGAALRAASARVLASKLAEHARKLGVSLIVLKEFKAVYRDALACFAAHGYTRVPSMPMTRLDIHHASFDDYMRHALSRSARKDLRRKFKAIDEVYPLYLQVYQRSSLRFEKLTRQYLCELGRRMPDRARFFVWRQQGRVIAFSLCMVHGDAIHDEYLGLDYAVALDLHLYHYTFRDIVSWAIARGYRWYCSNGLNYDPKLHLRHRLDPLDLYVRHTPYLQLATSVVLIAIAEVLLKQGAVVTAAGEDAAIFGTAALASAATWAGIALYAVSFLSWMHVLRQLALTEAFALSSLTQIAVPLAALMFLGEVVSPTRWAGITLVLAGILLVAVPAARAEERL